MKTQFKIVATTDDALEALNSCEYALREALRTDRIGWIQQVAHKNAVAALAKARLELATRNAVPAHDWPKPIPGRRGKEVRCKRCGRYSNEGDGPCVPAVAWESEVQP